MLPTVLCLAPTHALAEQILSRLKTGSVPTADIAVVGVPKDEKTPLEEIDGYNIVGTNSGQKAEAGAVAAILGAAAALMLPLVATLFLAGPALLTAGAATGAAAGAASSALADYELPKVYRDHYLHRLQHGGGYLILVRTEDEARLALARRICEETGGQDVAQVQFTVKLT